MKVVILGAGVTGLATAYYLSKAGHEVTVVDRQAVSGAECSFANGAQLSYEHAEPLATPCSLWKGLKWLGKTDAPLLIRMSWDVPMFKWLLQFVWECRPSKVKKNLINQMRLNLYNRKKIHEILAETGVECDFEEKGILHIYKDKDALASWVKQSEMQAELGAPFEELDAEGCVKFEPALESYKEQLVGGVVYPIDDVGNMHTFCLNLEKYCQEKFGTKFLFNADIKDIKTKGKEIVSLTTSEGELTADKYVVALGSYSSLLMKKIGISIPVYPVKGYSISVDVSGIDTALTSSITHSGSKLVYTRVGDILRVVGTAELTGYDDSITASRIAILKRATKEIFPDCSKQIDEATEWACLRPMVPDGNPILGATRYGNLYLNTGHGQRGWTQAAGSGKIVADVIEGNTPEIDLDGLTIDRF